MFQSLETCTNHVLRVSMYVKYLGKYIEKKKLFKINAHQLYKHTLNKLCRYKLRHYVYHWHLSAFKQLAPVTGDELNYYIEIHYVNIIISQFRWHFSTCYMLHSYWFFCTYQFANPVICFKYLNEKKKKILSQ